MPDSIKITVKNAVATLSINDAPYNRMTLDYMDMLENELPKLAADDEVRAMVFTAEGLEHFSVGMNLKEFPEGANR
jgi:enoyl-CoA hydratase